MLRISSATRLSVLLVLVHVTASQKPPRPGHPPPEVSSYPRPDVSTGHPVAIGGENPGGMPIDAPDHGVPWQYPLLASFGFIFGKCVCWWWWRMCACIMHL